MADFKAEVFQNEFLAEGATDVHAVVSVTCTDAGTAGQSGLGEAAEISSSTRRVRWTCRRRRSSRPGGPPRLPSSEIVDGTWFAVISGHSVAQMVYPSHPGMAKMTDVTRREAIDMIDAPAQRRSNGDRRVDLRSDRTVRPGADGAASRDPADRRQDRRRARRVRCHRRWPRPKASSSATAAASAPTGWSTSCGTIADALLGTVDIIAKPDDLEADFEAMIRTSMGRGVADARLRVWAPQGSEVQFVRQVAPTVEDLTAKAVQVAHWSASSRQARGATRVATTTLRCVSRSRRSATSDWRPASRWSSTTRCVAKSLVKATWSADANLTTRIDPAVAHYTGQAQLADAIQKGLAAKAAGDDRTATVLLGEAAKIAHDSGNEDTTRLLSKVVDVVDAEAGTVRLKSNIERTDEMALDTRSTKTTRIRRSRDHRHVSEWSPER